LSFSIEITYPRAAEVLYTGPLLYASVGNALDGAQAWCPTLRWRDMPGAILANELRIVIRDNTGAIVYDETADKHLNPSRIPRVDYRSAWPRPDGVKP
jgi:hypothetical protein